MTKEVIISIKGLQFVEEEEEAVELISVGNYSFQDGTHIVEYEEIEEAEGTKGITQNTISITPKQVEILRGGMNNVQMLFEENCKNLTYYQTPFGELLIGINTTKIRIAEREDRIMVMLEYGLEINYNHVSDCKITIKIAQKGK